MDKVFGMAVFFSAGGAALVAANAGVWVTVGVVLMVLGFDSIRKLGESNKE